MGSFSRDQVVDSKVETNSNKDKSRDIKLFTQEAALLAYMSACKYDIYMDTEYMIMYYPNINQIYNRGRLTVVSIQFMKWAKTLVTEVNLQINEHKILQKKQTIMKEVSTNILENKSLYSSFKIFFTLPGI